MNITLSPDTERLVNERVERGEYQSATELLDVAVHHLLGTVEQLAPREANGIRENVPALELEPLPSLKGTLPPNWKDDIY